MVISVVKVHSMFLKHTDKRSNTSDDCNFERETFRCSCIIFESACRALGINPDVLLRLIKVGKTLLWMIIKTNQVYQNLLESNGRLASTFSKEFGKHLKHALSEWMLGEMASLVSNFQRNLIQRIYVSYYKLLV